MQCERVEGGSGLNTIECFSKSTKNLITDCPSDSKNGEELSCDLYSRYICGLCRVGDVDSAMAFLSEMEALGFRPNHMSYSSLTTALGGVGRTSEAEAVFREMIIIDDLGMKGNRETFEILLDYHVCAGQLKDTWSVTAKMKQEGIQLNSFDYSKVIDLYRDNGMCKKATGIEGIRPDITAWNSLIRWYCKLEELANALELFTKIQEQGGLYPDPKIFIAIISRLGEHRKWDGINNNFEKMKTRGHQRSGEINAVIVDIYGQCGRFQDAAECINALRSEGVHLSASMFCLLANMPMLSR
ncbi:hypothetical protein LguiA_024280 [Lonicera macranthoides]